MGEKNSLDSVAGKVALPESSGYLQSLLRKAPGEREEALLKLAQL
jgi:hypothetical protein